MKTSDVETTGGNFRKVKGTNLVVPFFRIGLMVAGFVMA
jgi:hypothetical protein